MLMILKILQKKSGEIMLNEAKLEEIYPLINTKNIGLYLESFFLLIIYSLFFTNYLFS